MTLSEFCVRWESRAQELERLGALVPAADLCRAMLTDLSQLELTKEEPPLSLKEAAALSGYSEAHLLRLVTQGKLLSLRAPGRHGRHAFRRTDLPQKPSGRHTLEAGVHDLASRLYGGKEARNGQS
jgi:hypothetical protein